MSWAGYMIYLLQIYIEIDPPPSLRSGPTGKISTGSKPLGVVLPQSGSEPRFKPEPF